MAVNDPSTDGADLQLMLAAAAGAGRIAMRYYRADHRVWMKSGNSPVTEADIEVDDFLRETLLTERPDYGWISEESEHDAERLSRERVFIVDPIDGTRGFTAGEPQWSICLAVVRDNRPVSAVIHCPALERTFSAVLGSGAHLNGTAIVNPPTSRVRTVTASKRLNTEIADRFGQRVRVLPFVPSLAYRLAMVANGDVDGAFARPGAHDWDLAAADLIVSEAGGTMLTLEGEVLRYNREKLGVGALLAAGPGRHEALLALAKDGGFLQ